MQSDLVQMEREALNQKRSGNLLSAINTLESLIGEQPDWSHGKHWHLLAQCHEETGDMIKARECNLEALRRDKTNSCFLKAYKQFIKARGA